MKTLITATHVIAPDGRKGWFVRCVNGESVKPLGFAPAALHEYADLRKAMPGVVNLGTLDITQAEYSRLLGFIKTPDHMRRLADAIEGN